jgi:hypothetical protein
MLRGCRIQIKGVAGALPSEKNRAGYKALMLVADTAVILTITLATGVGVSEDCVRNINLLCTTPSISN